MATTTKRRTAVTRKSQVATVSPARDEDGYEELLGRMKERFLANAKAGPLFKVSIDWPFDTFLRALPLERRGHYSCRACRQFFERYAGLVVVNDDGTLRSAIFDVDSVGTAFMLATSRLEQDIRRTPIDGVFLTDCATLGTPLTYSKKHGHDWTHFHVDVPASARHLSLTMTPDQAAAEKAQDKLNVERALKELPRHLVDKAVAILKSDALYRSEKVLGQAEWLAKLHADIAGLERKRQDALIWRAVATAPAGFCHPRSSMIGSLLEDLADGNAIADVSRRFAAKMNPLQYQRPKAAPAAQTIVQAEKLVERLDAANALRRRYARLDEVEAVWWPRFKPGATGVGVFGHIKPRDASRPRQPVQLPATVMTWAKFRDTVLPTAEAIEYRTTFGYESFATLVTAVDPAAPPILQWDSEDQRNPVSWFFKAFGQTATNVGLAQGDWVKVNAITMKPCHWGGRSMAHYGEFVLFILEDAKPRNDGGIALFPEILKAEFHGVRAVLEAHSNSRRLEGHDKASACGIALEKGRPWNQVFRVTTSDGFQREIRLDRWD